MRQEDPPQRRMVRFGPFEADLRSRELRKHGLKIKLQEKPFKVLAVLLDHHGDLVTREDLKRELWSADTFVDFDTSLNAAMNKLREALNDSAETPRFIETLPRLGYRFVAPVEGLSPIAGVQESNHPRRHWQTIRLLGVAFAVLVVSLVGVNFGRLRRHLMGAPSKPLIRSLAVLPLENLTGDPTQEYFADGMTEVLTTELAQTAAISVISRTSAMQYKGRHKALSEIANELKVDAVVEGSLMRSGNRVRITAQLIHLPTDRHLWADSYERSVTDIFALQGELSRDIARQIRTKLTAEQQAHLDSMRDVNPEAYEAYLRALAHLDAENLRENEAAIALFERAATLDPKFAAPQVGLARAYLLKYFAWDPNKMWIERAARCVATALSLDPNLADAYEARGKLARTLSNPPYTEAIQDFRRAIGLNPNLAAARFDLGEVYIHIGLLDKALEQLQAAAILDPKNPSVLYRIARIYLYQRQYPEALAEFEHGAFPQDWQKALVLQYLGRASEAFELIQKLEKDFPRQEDVASTYAVLLAARGEKRKAEEKIRIAIEVGQGKLHFHHAEYNIASAYALMGRNDLAMKWLQRTADDGLPCYPLFEKDPNLDNLRRDSRFIAFMEDKWSQWQHWKTTL